MSLVFPSTMKLHQTFREDSCDVDLISSFAGHPLQLTENGSAFRHDVKCGRDEVNSLQHTECDRR